MVNFRECVLERFRGELRNFVEATGGLIDGFARGIVNGEAQMEARAAGGGGFGIGDELAKGARQTIAAADDAEADRLLEAVLGFKEQVFLEDVQRPLPSEMMATCRRGGSAGGSCGRARAVVSRAECMAIVSLRVSSPHQ